MRYFLFSFCLTIIALLCFTSSGETNDGPLGIVGGSVSPKGPHQSIRMDSEMVTIQLLENSYIVDAVFHFFNNGETTTEWVGFPKRWGGTHYEFIKFETWVNDQETQFKEERGGLLGIWNSLKDTFLDWDDDYRWMVKYVTFPGRSVTTTRVKYEAKYHISEDNCAM
jgi:hypothetical protein